MVFIKHLWQGSLHKLRNTVAFSRIISNELLSFAGRKYDEDLWEIEWQECLQYFLKPNSHNSSYSKEIPNYLSRQVCNFEIKKSFLSIFQIFTTYHFSNIKKTFLWMGFFFSWNLYHLLFQQYIQNWRKHILCLINQMQNISFHLFFFLY